MNILFDGRLLINRVTGIGYYIRNLLENIISIDRENYYTILLNNSLAKSQFIYKFNAVNIEKKVISIPEVGPKNQFLFPIKMRGQLYDLYHYPHFDLPLFMPFNSVVTIHDLKYILNPDFFPEFSTIKKLYMKNVMRAALHKARKVIVVSESTKRDIIKIFKILPEKIEPIPLSVDKLYKKIKDYSKLKLVLKKLGLNKNYFLFTGERRPHKNLVRIIEAFNIYKKCTGLNEELVVVGKPYSNYKEPEKVIKKLNLQKSVKLLGYVNDEELLHLYNGCKALIFTTLYEGFGIPILEAMACGVPVVTSNTSSLPEVAGNAALTVDPNNPSKIADAMLRLHQEPNLREDLIQKGFKRVKQFDWRQIAKKTVDVYHKAILNKC